MHDDMQEMKALFARMEIPAPASNLESRIIAAAKPRTQQLAQGGGWFANLRQSHGPKLAFAASLLVAVMIALSSEQDGVKQGDQPVTLAQQTLPEQQLQPDEREAAEAILAELELFDDPLDGVDYTQLF